LLELDPGISRAVPWLTITRTKRADFSKRGDRAGEPVAARRRGAHPALGDEDAVVRHAAAWAYRNRRRA
jgi:hypothetical protein